MLASCLLVVSTLKSSATGANDLGFRGILVVQFILLLWAAPLVHDLFTNHKLKERVIAPVWKRILVVTLVLGVMGTVYQLLVMRCYEPLADAEIIHRTEHYMGISPGMGERTYRLRDGFTQLAKVTSPESVLQYNPVSENALLIRLYSTHQTAAGDSACGSGFGGDVERCKNVMPFLAAVFNSPGDAQGWDMDGFCDALSVNLLVATDADPVWYDSSSWVWSRHALTSNDSMRSIPCGRAPSPQAAR
jgi:hypothetical protein